MPPPSAFLLLPGILSLLNVVDFYICLESRFRLCKLTCDKTEKT